MAAPCCRLVSAGIYRVLRGSSRYSAQHATTILCRRIRNNTPFAQRQLVQWRPLTTTCWRFNTPGGPPSQPSNEEPKLGLISRLALKTHHLTILILNKISPRARVFYERFVYGAKDFTLDLRHIYYLNRRLKAKDVRLEELEWTDIYKKLQMKQDLARVLPVLVIVNIPFVYYVTLPVVLYFQRYFLSDHFITPEDISSNHGEFHKKRRLLYPGILQGLEKRLVQGPSSDQADSLKERIEERLEEEPFTADELLTCRAIFSEQAALNSLSREHLRLLCKLHSQWILFAPASTLRRRLSTHAIMISLMDKAVLEAGLDSIDELDLRKLCNQRGFNPVGSDRQGLTQWLKEWGQVSTHVTDEERSLLLHASVLLATGRPHQGDDQPVKPVSPVPSPDGPKA